VRAHVPLEERRKKTNEGIKRKVRLRRGRCLGEVRHEREGKVTERCAALWVKPPDSHRLQDVSNVQLRFFDDPVQFSS
jgi:hypothetical protein